LQKELKEMARAGVVGFKCFLCPSGVDEFPEVTKQDLEAALRELEGTNSVLAVCCCKLFNTRDAHKAMSLLF
jgi:allantoinase